jgi:hypothetical protein
LKHGDFKCRFSSSTATIIVDGKFTYSPMVSALNDYTENTPNILYCKTPIWPLSDSSEYETVKLDMSVNGQFFSGGLEFIFTRNLMLHRDIPMAGTLDGLTQTTLIG